MARRPSSRVVINRAAVRDVRLGLADGLLDIGEAIIRDSHPPDAPPHGKGLVQRGGAVVFAGPNKLGGNASKPSRGQPRAVGLTMFVGWGFPARFQELGTVHQPARPFFMPAVNRVLPSAGRYLRARLRVRTG